MNIVGFNFTKISAERKRTVVGTVNIKNNINIKEIAEAKIGIGEGNRQAIKVVFGYTSEFTPDLAVLRMEGDILALMDKSMAADVVKEWSKEKKIKKVIAERVMNHILDRCNIQALLLAKDLNLPSPVPLPKVTAQAAKQVSEKKAKTAKKK